MSDKTKATKLAIYVLDFDAADSRWVLRVQGGPLVDAYARSVNQKMATKFAAEIVRDFWETCRQASELRIRRKNGSWAPARTYPRSMDPKRSKG